MHYKFLWLQKIQQKNLWAGFLHKQTNSQLTRTVLGHFGRKLFNFTTAENGGHRAMVPIGNYERCNAVRYSSIDTCFVI